VRRGRFHILQGAEIISRREGRKAKDKRKQKATERSKQKAGGGERETARVSEQIDRLVRTPGG
jgi:hypothetical protein